MSQLFHQLVRPMATAQTIGAFIGGLRVVVIDGTTFYVPEARCQRQGLWSSWYTTWYSGCGCNLM